MNNLLDRAFYLAKNGDVSTAKDGAVVYSISFMPNEENKNQAFDFVKLNQNAKMLDDTPCGKALIELGLSGKVNDVGKEITKVWKIASKRYIENASGNINAFVDGADERSTFYSTELEEILNNPNIVTINNIDKFLFAKNFKPKRY
ncbi:MAG: hypothetical protein IKW39_01370 [Alphaproteobacteria bacterium]|nr:hypothetical protein [Alphaproteobacteria bacterium]